MAFATLLSVVGTLFTTAATSYAVPMPATVDAGDLLLIFLGHDGQDTVAFNSVSGWTLVADVDVNATGRVACWKKIAAGNEDSTTVTVSFTGSNVQAMAYVLRYQAGTFGSGVLADVEELDSEATSATPDPPSLSPSWGSGDTSWIAFFECDSNRSVSAFPSSYGNTNDQGVTTNAAHQGICTRQNAVATENPGTFTISASDQWRAMTLAIRGLSAAAGQAPRTMHQARMRRVA